MKQEQGAPIAALLHHYLSHPVLLDPTKRTSFDQNPPGSLEFGRGV